MDAETIDLQVGILRDMASTMRLSTCELSGVVLADELDAFCDRVGGLRVQFAVGVRLDAGKEAAE